MITPAIELQARRLVGLGVVIFALSCGVPPQDPITDPDTQGATGGESESTGGEGEGSNEAGTSSDGTSDGWTADETGEPELCSADLPLTTQFYATIGDPMTITYGFCGYGCDCSRDLPCAWEASGVPQVPGVYPIDAIDAECVWCNNVEADNTGGPDTAGMLEIVRIDENGVQGCVIDSPCVGSFRFIAPWCSG